MRWSIVVACLVSVGLSGCANRTVEYVPAGVDRAELTAAIQRRGQDTAASADPSESEPQRPLTRLDRGAHVVIDVAPTVLGCAAVIPVYVLYIMAKAHYPG
jgi:hypothetical protein